MMAFFLVASKVTSHPKTQVNLETDIQEVSVEADSNAMQSGYPGNS